MLNYFIQCRDNKEKKVVFKEVKGYKLPYGFAAHKDLENNFWVLDDLNSGCVVKSGFPNYNNLKAFLENSDIIDKVVDRRKTQRYSNLVKRNREAVSEKVSL